MNRLLQSSLRLFIIAMLIYEMNFTKKNLKSVKIHNKTFIHFEQLQYFEPSTSFPVAGMIPERSQQTLTDMLGILDLTGLRHV